VWSAVKTRLWLDAHGSTIVPVLARSNDSTGTPYVIDLKYQGLVEQQARRIQTSQGEEAWELHFCLREPNKEVEAWFDRAGFERDPDVLDTWFSSALWPLSTLGWPEPAQSAQTAGLLEAFNPTSVLSTAREIITLWVSRMVMMNRYLLPPFSTSDIRHRTSDIAGPIPFHDVFIHAVVQDGEGRKMSKSLNNGVDPLDIIESHGADAMRFTLAQMTTQTQDVRMPVKPDPKTGKNSSDKFDAGRNFCNKLWNASRFAIGIVDRNMKEGRVPTPYPTSAAPHASESLSLVDKWLRSRLGRAIRTCEACLNNYEFADYCQTLYQLVWWDYCDWYLEAIKPTVDRDPGQLATMCLGLSKILHLLHPVAPFITEEIWSKFMTSVTGESREDRLLLCQSTWPQSEFYPIDEASEKAFEELRELITAIRNVRAEHQVLPKRRITLHCSQAFAGRLDTSSQELVVNLAGLETFDVMPVVVTGQLAPGVSFRACGEEMYITNLADAIDATLEGDRLSKQLETLRKSEGALNGRLSNPGYVDKAPAKLVEESKAQLEKIRAEIAAIEGKLKSL
jgi:valyl-tRNA synthetase